LLTTEAFYYSS